MTLEEDRADLARHAGEMATHEPFNYAIMQAEGSATVGCVYIDPPDLDAEVKPLETDVWRYAGAGVGLPDAVAAFVPAWLEREWPFEAV